MSSKDLVEVWGDDFFPRDVHTDEQKRRWMFCRDVGFGTSAIAEGGPANPGMALLLTRQLYDSPMRTPTEQELAEEPFKGLVPKLCGEALGAEPSTES